MAGALTPVEYLLFACSTVLYFVLLCIRGYLDWTEAFSAPRIDNCLVLAEKHRRHSCRRGVELKKLPKSRVPEIGRAIDSDYSRCQ
jgi:hypothetical protein